MDRAVWAIFYDLPEEGRDEYMAWFHEVHIPEKLARPGYLWAAHYETRHPGERFARIAARLRRSDDPAHASGAGFIALFGGESTRTFYDPSPAELRERQSPETRRMTDARIRAKGLILCEEWRVEGPEAGAREAPGVLAPAMQMGRYDAGGEDEDLEAWYARERMAGVSTTPGCLGARKYLAATGAQRHAVLYEFASLAAREAHYVALEETEWTRRVHGYLTHPPGSPLVGSRLWPPLDAPNNP